MKLLPFNRFCLAVLTKHLNRFTGGLGLLCGLLMLGGCSLVGPDYTLPELQTSAAWTRPLEGGLTVEPVDSQDIRTWWAVLNDPILTELVECAARKNLSLRETRARLREARALRGLSQTGLWPKLNTQAGATRHRSSASSGSGNVGNLYTVGFDAGWELDIFGGVQRSIEAAQADMEAAAAGLRDLQVSLAAETALNYLEARTFQARLRHTTARISNQKERLELQQSLHEAGLVTNLDLQEDKQLLAELQAATPDLETGLNATLNRLAVLVGGLPGTLNNKLEVVQQIPELPAHLAVGIPAETLRRRPDVRQSERQLAAQTARIGVAKADLYPRFSLSGLLGLEAVSGSDLLQTSSRVWRVGPSLRWNIFDAGAVRQNIEVQNARQERALANYEKTVLEALEDVENALFAYAKEQTKHEALMAAAAAGEQKIKIASDLYRSGLADYNDVLEAKRSHIVLQDALIRSSGTKASNLVRLYKALGGGWQISRAEQI